jgi:cell division protein FtsZ
VDEVNNQYHEELLKNQEAENIVENTSKEHEMSFSEEAISTAEPAQETQNDLKEFGVDANEPDLFNTDSEISSTENLLGTQEDDEDDLEIPAFLRRQKN